MSVLKKLFGGEKKDCCQVSIEEVKEESKKKKPETKDFPRRSK